MTLARTLVILGILFILAGGVVYLVVRTGIPLGRLPGDIRIERSNFSCFFPIVTMVLLSILLTVLLNVIARFLNK